MSKKVLITLDDEQLAWLDDFRFAQRFEGRSEAVRWLLNYVRAQPELPMRAVERIERG